MKKALRKNNTELIGMHDKITGDVSGIWGDVSDIMGDVSGIQGDVSEICGNVNNCELTEEDRKKGININDLIIN
jgi:hypothetical protein